MTREQTSRQIFLATQKILNKAYGKDKYQNCDGCKHIETEMSEDPCNYCLRQNVLEDNYKKEK